MGRSKILKEMHALEEEIKILEIKRSRSIAVILEALISRVQPDEDDVQFFRTFTAEIEVKREQLQRYQRQLDD